MKLIQKAKEFSTAYYRFFRNKVRDFKKSRRYKRYRYLIKFIKEKKCRRIMEIGVWNGNHALQMINEAKKYHGNTVEYYGFDLFELFGDHPDSPLDSVKTPPKKICCGK